MLVLYCWVLGEPQFAEFEIVGISGDNTSADIVYYDCIHTPKHNRLIPSCSVHLDIDGIYSEKQIVPFEVEVVLCTAWNNYNEPYSQKSPLIRDIIRLIATSMII